MTSESNELEKKIKKNLKKINSENKNFINEALKPTKIISDIISGIAVGGFLGYFIDCYTDTLPLFIFIFIIIGAVVGVYIVHKDILAKEKISK